MCTVENTGCNSCNQKLCFKWMAEAVTLSKMYHTNIMSLQWSVLKAKVKTQVHLFKAKDVDSKELPLTSASAHPGVLLLAADSSTPLQTSTSSLSWLSNKHLLLQAAGSSADSASTAGKTSTSRRWYSRDILSLHALPLLDSTTTVVADCWTQLHLL
jgi:hypothetical protein